MKDKGACDEQECAVCVCVCLCVYSSTALFGFIALVCTCTRLGVHSLLDIGRPMKPGFRVYLFG